jgi:outer membrane protein assembly complex protein YaeT
MRSVSSYRFLSSRLVCRHAKAALLLVLGLLAASDGVAARSDPALVRRAAARLTPAGPTVADIIFEGNDTFDDELLFLYMHTRESGLIRKSYYDRRTFLQDLANLERFYVSQGFLDADVEVDDISLSPDSGSVEILIGVYEGDRWAVESVTFTGERVITEGELRALVVLDRGSPLVVSQVEQDRRVISEEYARRSYLDARVSQEVTRDDERRLVAIDYTIAEREQATIASIDVEGDEKIRKFVVERELTFREGELFDFEKIGESQALLYRTGLFNSVWIEPSAADTGKSEKRVIVRVSERVSGEFDLSASYAGINFTEGLQNLDFLELGAELRNRNVQGQATNMTLGGRYSGLARDVRASVGDPWFLGKRVAAEFAAQYEWKEEEKETGSDRETKPFVTEVTSGSFILSRKLDLNLTFETGYEYSHNYDESSAGSRSTKTSALLLGAVYDSRNDVLSASRGMFLSGEADIASRRLGGTNDFTRFEVDWRGYITPRRGRVAALELRVGWIDPRGDDSEVPELARYYKDMEGLVRGFPIDVGERPRGMALVLARGEVRFPVRKSLRGAAFVDAGRVFGHIEDVDLSQLRVGAGLGLRFETRVGVVRLDVATPVSRKGEPQFYLGVGQVF